MSKVFFIIPVYNVEKYLKRCVDSVLGQTYGNIRIILVDDGSTDNSPAICDEYVAKYDNITVIHKANGGLSDARNAALSYVWENASEDDYLTFLDSDDFVSCDFSEKLLNLCEKNDCDIAQCGYEKGRMDSFESCKKRVSLLFCGSCEALLGYHLKSQCCAKMYKVKTFNGIAFPMGVINEDEFVTYRAVFNAKNVAFTDENLYYYYQHDTSIMDNVAKKLKNNPRRYDFLEAYRQREEFFKDRNMPLQVMKTYEKICTDIILRYCEQMYLKREERDVDCNNGTYMRIYRDNFRKMIKRRAIPPKRRMMYISFYIMPISAVIMGRIFTLRK